MREGSFVRLQGSGRTARITRLFPNGEAEVQLYLGGFTLEERRRVFPLRRLVFLPPKRLAPEALLRFAQGGRLWPQLAQGAEPEMNVQAEEAVRLTAQDLLQGVRRAAEEPERFAFGWVAPLAELFFSLFVPPLKEAREKGPVEAPLGEAEAFWTLLEGLLNLSSLLRAEKERPVLEKEPLEWLEETGRLALLNTGKPPIERQYTRRQMLATLRTHYREPMASTQEQLALCRRFLPLLCEQDDVDALRMLAFSSYGGDRLFGTDWNTSRRCFERLYELTEDGDAANSLGDIAYDGRCTGGVPDYEEAFRWFSIGAFHFHPESLYKLSDLFRLGRGTRRSVKAAANIVVLLYDRLLGEVCGGEVKGRFADVALRMGELFERGEAVPKNLFLAYRFYLQAQCALRLRMEAGEQYGDKAAEANISRALGRVREDPERDFSFSREADIPPALFEELFEAKETPFTVQARVTRGMGGACTVAFRRRAEKGKQPPLMLIAMPPLDSCRLVPGFTAHFREASVRLMGEGEQFTADACEVGFTERGVPRLRFYFQKDLVASLVFAGASMKKPPQRRGQKGNTP